MADLLTIDRLGHRGDGVAETPSGPVFVAHTLPGETVEVERTGADRARLLRVLQPSPERAETACPHVGLCGGCAVQHLAAGASLAWKRRLLGDALALAGVAAEIAPAVDAHGAGRRRLTLHARRQDGRLRVGFTEAKSHAVVELDICPLLAPGLEPAIPAVRRLAELAAPSGKPVDAVATLTAGGIDIDLRGTGPVAEKTRLALVAAAERLDLARLSLHGEVLIARRPATVRIGRASVVLPPGGFLQATEAGEAALAGLVAEGTRGARRILDLFAGIGTFALRLAENAQVHAVESDKTAVAALLQAARGAAGLKPVTAEARDLTRRPLAGPELAKAEAVVFDPPRAGAEAQARLLAASRVPKVVAVSCNPATLGRDLAILTAGGYRIASVTPVDQFRHAAHVEAVAVLEKAPTRGR